MNKHAFLHGLSLLFLINTNLFGSEELVFPKGFKKGVARSFYQDGGHNIWANGTIKPESNWTAFENSKIKFNARHISLKGISPIHNGDVVGRSANGWEKAIEDIQLLKKLGCNSQRFSIEWTDIEPEEGKWNEEALTFYEKYCDELKKNDIEPMVTLLHFVHPNWFEKKGGFTKEENISLFVRYCEKVFERLGTKVPLWCTINEPTVLGACGYILGIHTPGKFGQFAMAGTVLKNLLTAHVEVYKKLKSMPNGKQVQIGLVHQLMKFEAYNYYTLPWYFHYFKLQDPISVGLARTFNFSFASDIVKRFLKTGVFEYKAFDISRVLKRNGINPFININFTNPDAPNSYDFIGLNFYSRVILGPGPARYPEQIMTDMDYAIRPNTIYEAIHEMAELGKPIYITENGIADKKDVNRAYFIKEYLKEVKHAMDDGIDIRGYYYWTLLDNFEWNEAFSMKFGLYHVDFDTQKRTLREGSKAYRDFFQIEK